MKKLQTKLALIAVLVASFMGLATLGPALPALAQNSVDEAQKGANATGANNAGDIPKLAEAIVDILSWVVGVAAVIMVIIGGFKYVTSNGDSGQVASAKNTIIYAIVGLVIVIFAQTIVKFVIARAT